LLDNLLAELEHRFNNFREKFIHMRSGKDGEYYFVEIESRDEFDKLRELTLKKLEIEKLLKKRVKYLNIHLHQKTNTDTQTPLLVSS